MRTLDELRSEVLSLCFQHHMVPSDAIDKLAPFDDLEPEALQEIIRAGLTSLLGDDLNWFRGHLTESASDHDAMDGRVARAYMGRFQLRPTEGATAQAIYINLSAPYEGADGLLRRLIDFTEADWSYNAERAESHANGWARRLALFTLGLNELRQARKARTSDLPKAALRRLDEAAGAALQ